MACCLLVEVARWPPAFEGAVCCVCSVCLSRACCQFVLVSFPFGFQRGMWHLVVSVSDYCISFIKHVLTHHDVYTYL